MKQPEYFLGSVNEALSYGANALMIYTGPPQSSYRKDIGELKIKEAIKIWKDKGFSSDHFVVHAPYIINLASIDETKRKFGIDFLIKEVQRTDAFGAKYIVLHPGSSVKTTPEKSIQLLAESLNLVISQTKNVIICLETMAGKGNEIGKNFEQLKSIIDGISDQSRIGVCFDTCHVHDAGYDLSKFDEVMHQFDEIIGLNKLKVVHFNDSLNPISSHKDRHANINKGCIGLKILMKIIQHEALKNIPFILETPYIDDQPPYTDEIALIRKNLD